MWCPIVPAGFDLADFVAAMTEVQTRRAIGRVVLMP